MALPRPLVLFLAAAPLASGSVVIEFAGNTRKCLDLPGGNTNNGNLLQIWDCNGSPNQNWDFDAGSWQIKSAKDSRKCVDIKGGLTEGMRLQIWDCNGHDNQIWGYDSNMKTIYAAKSALTGANLSRPLASKCMDLAGGNTNNGNGLQLWTCNGLPNQRWVVAAPGPSPSPGPGPGPSPSPGGCYGKTGISQQQLQCTYPQLDSSKAGLYANALNSWLGSTLGNACSWAAFLGNVGTESNGLTEWTQVPCDAGTDAPYCGRGPLQITGRSNYAFCAGRADCKCGDIVSNPASVSDDTNIGMGTTLCVWADLSGHSLSHDADGTLTGLLKTACIINAGHYPCGTPNGWESRQQYWHAANKCLGIGSQVNTSDLMEEWVL